jgi:hypothetical protein
MLDHVQIENLLFIDIETAPEYAQFQSVPKPLQPLYLKKSERLKKETENNEDQYFNHAGIYAEFGKIICISVGIIRKDQLRIKSFSGHEEKKVLLQFCELLNTHYDKPKKYSFCGHNACEFDIPYLCRRLLINQIDLPAMLDIGGKKPYESTTVDTLHLWRFGDYKHYTSLNLLALILGIESPKEDMDGKDVGRIYWKENNLKRIVEYCQRDVVTVAQLLLRFKGEPSLNADQIVFAATENLP